MKLRPHYFFIIIALIGIFFGYIIVNQPKNKKAENNQQARAEQIKDKFKTVTIQPNETFGEIMTANDFEPALANTFLTAAEKAYDLSRIRAGNDLVFVYDKETNEFKQLIYEISSEEELYINKESETWIAVVKPIEYEIRVKAVNGTIESSLYESAMAQGIDERAVVELGDIFDWTIDFAQDPRVGDTYKFIYEERYRNGEYVMPGNILAARYVNAGATYNLFYFQDGTESGYYDENGLATQKMFLKAPVSFRYISSGFTTGKRYISAFNMSTGHRAIDYAASKGTPIRSVADGTVIFAGWAGSYGNKITIRHNGTYSTNYCHQSKFAVKVGQKVKQGQTIGYVGSTGLSTGPHLHYEMVKNGVKINPLLEKQPPGKPIKSESKEAFRKVVGEYNGQLN